MKPQYIILMTLFCLIGSFVSRAQEQDEQAGEILDQFVQKTQKSDGFESAYLFTVIDLKEDAQSSSEGRFFMKGEKYIVKSEQMDIYYDGMTLWNFLPDVNEVNISIPESSDDQTSYFDNPTRLFSIYKDDFFFSYIGEDVRKTKPVHVLDLYPKQLDKSFSRIRLAIEKESFRLFSAQIFSKDGVHYLLEITSIKTQPLDDSFFRFDASQYPGVEVIDLR